MAQYRTHLSFNLLLGYPIGAIIFYVYYSTSHLLLAIFSICFLLSTLFLNPDLDIANTVKFFSVRGLLTLPFRPYSYVFSHRGISHFPIVGTATRLAYMGLLTSIVFFCYFGEFPPKELIVDLYNEYMIPFWVGVTAFVYADLCHILLDRKK